MSSDWCSPSSPPLQLPSLLCARLLSSFLHLFPAASPPCSPPLNLHNHFFHISVFVSSLLVFCSSYFFSSRLHNGFCCRSELLFCWKHLNTKAPDEKMKPTLLTMRIFDNNCCASAVFHHTLSTSGSAGGLHCCTVTKDTSSLSLPVFISSRRPLWPAAWLRVSSGHL